MFINGLIASIVMFVLDATYVGTQGPRICDPNTRIQERSPMHRPIFTIPMYALMALGLNLFVIPNIHASTRWTDSITYGGGYGVCAYGIYSCTTMTIFNKWTFAVVLADTCWGAFVFGASSLASSYF